MNTDLSKRNSNFELIRIIGMLFIVSSHLAVHGVINTADVVWKDGSAVNDYSCVVTPQVRQTGNRLSGLVGTAYASLLA